MYERFTDRARKVMQLANQEAQRLNVPAIEPMHILAGLAPAGGVAAQVLVNLEAEITLAEIRGRLTEGAGPLLPMGKLPHTPETKRVVEESIAAARSLSHNYVGTEHLLLGLLAVDGAASELLRSKGLTACQVESEIRAIVQPSKDAPPPATMRIDYVAAMNAGMIDMPQRATFAPPAVTPPYRFALTANGITYEISAPTLEGLRLLGILKFGPTFWDDQPREPQK